MLSTGRTPSSSIRDRLLLKGDFIEAHIAFYCVCLLVKPENKLYYGVIPASQMLLELYQLEFLSFVKLLGFKFLSQFEFKFCHNLSWVLPLIDVLSFVFIWFTVLVFLLVEFCHNLIFSVLRQLECLPFVTVWVFEFYCYLSF